MVEDELFLEILLLLVLAKVFGDLFSKKSLPRVTGELLAGVLLGPSLLGIVEPKEELELLSFVGLVFFMLSTGLEVDFDRLMRSLRGGIIVAFSGVIFPFTLGYLIGIVYGFGHVASFGLGVCLSITAIGLSVRTLVDLGMLNTRVGLTIVNAAVVDDVIGLVLMVVAFSLAKTEVSHCAIALPLVCGASFVVASFALVRYVSRSIMLRAFIAKKIRSDRSRITLAVSLALLFGLLARASYLHEIVGVFIAGMLLRNMLSEGTEKEILDFTFAFFAMFFFAYVGVKTNFRVLTYISDLALAVLAAAIVGKVVGGFIGAKAIGFRGRDAVFIGCAMNARAAVELAIADAFYLLGIFSLEAFVAVVFMASVTSVMTPIMLKAVAKIFDMCS